MDKLIVTRDVTPAECEWLQETVKEGTVVVEAGDPWGCCGPDGTMVTCEDFECPTELPNSALKVYTAWYN